MKTNRNRRVAEVDEERIGELKVSEYLIFLFALDTYMRYLEEIRSLKVNLDVDPDDSVLKQGLALLRMADREHLEIVEHEISASVTMPASLSMLKAAVALIPTARGAALRALKLRTILSKGGTTTTKAIFGKSIKARQEIREAIDAAMLEDADSALAKLAMIDIRNTRLERWIDLASETAKALPTPDINPIQAASNVVTESTQTLLQAGIAREGSNAASEESATHTKKQNETLREIERTSQAAASKGLEKSGEPDAPVTRSEAIAIATTVAAAQKADPVDLRNIPPAFINNGRPLDPEQMAAAMTDGRVLVAAGAGSGKTTTLVSRVAYLVQSRGVKPSKIFVCSFNKKAAGELRARIGAKVGDSNRDQMSIGTMNSLFMRFIVGDQRSGIPAYGTPEERGLFTESRLIVNPDPPNKPKPGPKPINMTKAIQGVFKQCASMLPAYTGWPKEWFNDIPKAKTCTTFVSVWKGNDIDWQTARSQASTRSEKIASLWYEFYLGLKGDIPGWRGPSAVCKSRDDWMKNYRPGGERLGDLDDQIRVFRDILKRDPSARQRVQGMYDHIAVDEAQDRNVLQSEIFDLMSEHVGDGSDGKSLWVVGDDKQCVHEDTPVLREDGTETPVRDLVAGDKVLSLRNGHIKAQTVLHVVKTSWTWGYQIMTASGNTLTMSSTHKIWATEPVLAGGVHLVAHGLEGSRVLFEWPTNGLNSKSPEVKAIFQQGKVEKVFDSYRDALTFAHSLSDLLVGAPIRERLTVGEETLNLLPAAGLIVGMSVPVHVDGDIILDPIISIKKVDGSFIDIDVDDASNFFGGGILSHNSIYQFRGARPELFTELYDKEGWTTRMIRTNYRCAPEVVEAANKLMTHNKKQIPMESRANPEKVLGHASIIVSVPDSHSSGAIATIERIAKETTKIPIGQGHALEDYAVLARTNQELADFETACCIAEVPYARTGARGLFDSMESRTVLGYIDLAYGTDYEKMTKSLIDALTKPDRGLFLGYGRIAQIVEETIGDIARTEGRNAKSINPLDVIMKERYANELALALKTPYRAKIPPFVFDKTVRQLTLALLEMGRQISGIKNTLAEGNSAGDVISTVLDGVSSTVTLWDKDLRREVTTMKTLREQITEDLAVFGDDDEEVDAAAEETVAEPIMGPDGEMMQAVPETPNPAKGLGAVQFLYLLNQQNNADIEEGTDPSTSAGFLKKLTRIRNNSDKLRVDLNKWAKDNDSLPPGERRSRPDCIILATVHGTKGAEWRDVTVVMAPGKFPMKRRVENGENPPTAEKIEAEMSFERNLGYVAMTRAAESLNILCPPQGKNTGLSQFVTEAGLHYGQNVEIPDSETSEEPSIEKTASTWEASSLNIEYLNQLADITAAHYGR